MDELERLIRPDRDGPSGDDLVNKVWVPGVRGGYQPTVGQSGGAKPPTGGGGGKEPEPKS